jgi:drug/metabolite transporter (DMT)-like permease
MRVGRQAEASSPPKLVRHHLERHGRIERHDHDRHQLLYPTGAVVTVATDVGTWVIPPLRAGHGASASSSPPRAALLGVYGASWVTEGARPEGWQQLALLGGVTFAMGLQGSVGRELGHSEAGTTYMSGTLTGMVSVFVTRRRPDAGAALAIAGILAGVALLQSAPDLTPFLAVAGVAFTAALSWKRHCNTTRRSGSTKIIGVSGFQP